ncbi:MAG: ABC transporter permease [Desulfobacterales bacterium]|nr:ABC transporter permease [Desulfobacterales bacterium]
MTEYKIGYPNWRHFNIHEWWQYRELFWFLAWRDIKVKYKQTILGISWAILQPLVLMAIFNIFWKKAIKIDTGVPYPIFVYSGLIIWGLFFSGVSNSSNSMINNANVIKKVYFPRIIIPTSAILVSLVDFFITVLFYIILLFYYKIKLNILTFLFFLTASLLITLLVTIGFGLLLAAINIRYRDVRYAIPFLLQLLFFATPIIFPVSVIESKLLNFILALNPMATAIHFARVSISIQPIDWSFAALGLISSLCVFIGGLILFNKNEIDCADIL